MSSSTSVAENLPTGEPIPAPTSPIPSSSSSSPKKTTPATAHLKSLLRTLPHGADAFLAHLQRCLATPSGTDTTLLFICYASRLSSALLAALSTSLLRRSARSGLLTLAFVSSSSSTTTSPATTAAAAAAEKTATLAALVSARLKNLGSLASEARTIARLWGLLGMYFWARRLVLQLLSSDGGGGGGGGNNNNKKKEKQQDTTATLLVSWAQLISCTAFQYLENVAYLSGRGVLGWTPKQQGRAYVVASRWLAVYTGLEIGKLLAEIEERAQAEEAVRRSMAINLAWTPLTLHWATEGGFLTDAAVGFGGCIPGVIQMRKLWRETAQ
ncbi:hypothetical protein M406DRAFT_283973 [Cryphonectria parasitica EP155]|uniref:Peroxin 11C n=1 Tax=Cryphonectria parasitica (strain ATCC 38755 / EP155) TaxID=660469 RepID=A0A9P4YAP5_CRYP1|nr:uncharacterized protein M406DRAFT_283973 [Cryphonectria parasitica EP155]KAF3769568.1 hypothetical protein M406DRAFT_283973 [Cryphonectria parasitica EP155]